MGWVLKDTNLLLGLAVLAVGQDVSLVDDHSGELKEGFACTGLAALTEDYKGQFTDAYLLSVQDAVDWVQGKGGT